MEVKINFKDTFKVSQILGLTGKEFNNLYEEIMILLSYKLIALDIQFRIRGDYYIFDDSDCNDVWYLLHKSLNYYYGDFVSYDTILELISISKKL